MKKMRQFKPSFEGWKPDRSFNGRGHIDALYDSVWSSYSRKFLGVNPLCYACGEKSQVTDHLRPHKGDIDLFKKLDNHIPLCNRCHNTITARFDKNYKPGQPITEKLKWIANTRHINAITIRSKVLPSYE